MKIICIGDLHGLNIWKKIIDQQFDLCIFFGDYFDSFDVPFEQQISNFEELISFKESNPDRCVLLFGNHEHHYLRSSSTKFSGYQYLNKFDIQEKVHYALDKNLFQICYLYNDFLFSHAGFTRTWCKGLDTTDVSFVQKVNDWLYYKPNLFDFTIGRNFSRYGDDVTQGPLWVRPNSLLRDKIDGYTQVVGHTVKRNIEINNKLVFIDTLQTSKEYLVINGNVLSIENID